MSVASVNNTQMIGSQFHVSQEDNRQKASASFMDILKNAVNDVNETEKAAKQSEALAAAGQTDNLHTLMINTAKADLALETLVQIRNKALDSYNEIMKISV